MKKTASRKKSSIQTGDIHASDQARVNIAGGNLYLGMEAQQVQELLHQIAQDYQPRPFSGECPYVGLAAFTEQEAEMFFGRERLVGELLERVKETNFLMVSGPSGCGKSSLVRAGLLSGLKKGGLPGSQRWLYLSLSPGRDPLEQLALAAARLRGDPADGEYLRQRVRPDPGALLDKLLALLSDQPQQRAVVLVDQFEEIFTQLGKEKEAERLAFLEALVKVCSQPEGRVLVICTMRSDFLSACASYPALNRLINQGFFQVGAMLPEELVQAIARPAQQVGLRIDPELVQQIVFDMQGEPGALPLMQFALKNLFETLQEKQAVVELMRSDYLALGGLQKALERYADTAFASLQPTEQKLARLVFGSLVQVSTEAQDTRRTALFAELVPAGIPASQVESLVRQLADARLITTDEGEGQERTVAIAHERLIQAWPWLRRLVDENRQAIAMQNQIAEDALEWQKNQGDPSYLYTGARLAAAQERVQAHTLQLTELSHQFLEAASQVELERQRAEERRRAKELEDARRLNEETERRRKAEAERAREAEARLREAENNQQKDLVTARKLRRFVIVLGVLLLVAVASAAFAFRQTILVERQGRIVRANDLAAHAQTALEQYPARSLLLAVQAVQVTLKKGEPVPPLAEQTLRQVLQQTGGVPYSADGMIMSDELITPDGLWLVTAEGGRASVRAMDKNSAVRQIYDPNRQIVYTAVALSLDQRWLFMGGGAIAGTAMVQQTDFGLIVKTDPGAFPNMLATDEALWEKYPSLIGGRTLGGGVRTLGQVQLDRFLWLPSSRDIWDLVTSRRGTWLIARGDKSIGLWKIKPLPEPVSPLDIAKIYTETSAGPEAMTEFPGSYTGMTTSPDGHWLVAGDTDGNITIWDIGGSEISSPVTRQGHEGAVAALQFDENSYRLMTSGADNKILIWKFESAPPQTPAEVLSEPGMEVSAVQLSPGGNPKWLAKGSPDGTVVLQDLHGSSTSLVLPGFSRPVSLLRFSPDGRWLAGSSESDAMLWDLEAKDPAANPVLLHGHERPISKMDFSDGSKELFTTAMEAMRRWDLSEAKPGRALKDPLLPLDSLINLACATAGRAFTQEEWSLFFPGEPYRASCP